MNKYFRYGLPIVFVAIIVGVLLGVFLPEGSDDEDTARAPEQSETQTEPSQEAAGAPPADQAAPDKTAPTAPTETAPTETAPTETTEASDRAEPAESAERDVATAEPEAAVAEAVAEQDRQAAPAPAPEKAAQKAEQPVEQTVAEAVAETGAAPAEAPPTEAEPDITPPSFDVVRINPRGEAVIAGRAEPGAEVRILDAGEEIASVKADQRGEWVVLPDEPLKSGVRELSLEETAPTGELVESEQVVVLSVPERETAAGAEPETEETALAVLVPREGGPSKVLQMPREPAAAADEATRPAPVEEGLDELRRIREGRSPTQFLPPVEAEADDAEEADLTIKSIDYDETGEVTLAGQVEPGAAVNVYVDDEYIGTAEADKEGSWELEPGDKLEPGVHNLRIDKVDRTGVVISRIETPLARVTPEEIALGDALIIVQPGNSLWRIARRTYGGGVHYTEIYQANRGQVRNPDLIYPGQVLTIPVIN